MHQLDAALPDDAIVVADMTIHGYWGVLYLDARRPGGFCYPMSGALGSGIPTALGNVAANPGSPTVVLVGDGGFLMGGHELVTAQQNGLHFVTLLVNDACFGVLKNYQMEAYGRSTAVELRSPDFEQLAAAYGVGYRRSLPRRGGRRAARGDRRPGARLLADRAPGRARGPAPVALTAR